MLKKGIFFASTGRYGTMTCQKILEATPGILAHHEPYPKLFDLGYLKYLLSKKQCTRPFFKSEIINRRRKYFKSANLTKQFYAETSPHITFLIDDFISITEEFKIVWLVRNPLDFVTSALNRDYYTTKSYNDTWRIHPFMGYNFSKNWSSLNLPSKCLWLWAETNKYIFNLIQSLPDDTVHIFQSSDIFLLNDNFLNFLNEVTGTKIKRSDLEKTTAVKHNKQNISLPENEDLKVSLFDERVLKYASEISSIVCAEKLE